MKISLVQTLRKLDLGKTSYKDFVFARGEFLVLLEVKFSLYELY